MARVDLSQLNIPVAEVPRGQQIFSGQGQQSYEALSSVTKNLGNVAIDLYHKQKDVNTDREAQDAWGKMDGEIANKKSQALVNIDVDTNLVKGTKDTYEQHIAKFRAEKFTEYGEGLEDDLARGKFNDIARPRITEDNIKDLYLGVSLTKKNVLDGWDKTISSTSDPILLSSASSTDQSYKNALDQINLKYPTMEKTIGLGPASLAKDKAMKEIFETKLRTNLRNAQSFNGVDSKMAADSFGRSLGPSLGLADIGEYRKYVQQKIDLSGIKDGTPEGQKLYDSIMEDLTGKDIESRFKTTPPDKNADLLSAQEKNDYLDKFLTIKFKMAVAGKNSNIKQLEDWKANSLAKGSITDLKEFSSIVTSPDYKGEKTDIIRDVSDAVFTAFLNKAHKQYIPSGGTSDAGWQTLIDEDLNNSLPSYLKAGGITREEYDKAIKDNPSLGMKDKTTVLNTLHTEAEKWRTEMNNNPASAIVKTEEYTDVMNNAFKVKGDGTFLIDKEGAIRASKYINDAYDKIHTGASRLESEKLMPDEFAKKIFDKVNLERPEQQVETYKSVNLMGPNAATSFYTQAIAKNGMKPRDANLYMNMGENDSPTKLAIDARIISLRNKYTGPDGQKQLIENLNVAGMFKSDNGFKEVDETLTKMFKNNDYLKDLKKVARKAGVGDDQIVLMYDTQNIRLAILDDLNNNPPEGEWYNDLEGRMQPVVDKTIKQFFTKKAVVSDAISAILPEDSSIDIDTLKANASSALDSIKEGLKNNLYKLDFSEMTNLPNAAKNLKDMSQSTMQNIFLKEKMDGLSFASADITGKNNELYLMSKSNGGVSTRLKLLKTDGKSDVFKVNPNGLEKDSFNKTLSRYTQSEKLSAPKEISAPVKFAIGLVNEFEGFSENPYPSVEGGEMSVGYGTKFKKGETPYKMTREDGIRKRNVDLIDAEKTVSKKLTTPVPDKIKGVLADMVYNGKPGYADETIKLVNQGKHEEAMANILKLVKVKINGKYVTVENQVKRAKRRVELYRQGLHEETYLKKANEKVLFGDKGLF
jgi:GH24 family phage-related lysozyme (muramidase)